MLEDSVIRSKEKNLRRYPQKLFFYLAILIFLIFVYGRLSLPISAICDDAFISFRYAKHLADGQGLVFNLGERVEGYTNFLWVLLLGAFYKMGFPLPETSQWVALFEAALLVVLVGTFSKNYFISSRFPLVSLIAPVLLGTSPLFLEHSRTGLETMLLSCLTFASFWCYSYHGKKKYIEYATGFFLGLAYLSRPDAGLWFIGFVAADFLSPFLARERESSRKSHLMSVAAYSIVFFSVVFIHLLWRISYYHDILPNTYYAKNITNWTLGWNKLKDSLPSTGYLLPVVPLLALWQLRSRWAIFSSLIILMLLLYDVRLGGDFIYTFRFLIPVLPLFFLLLQELMRKSLLQCLTKNPRVNLLPMFGFVFPLLLLLFGSYHEVLFMKNSSKMNKVFNEYSTYLAFWVKSHTQKEDTIALVPAGIVPYYCERRFIDMAGLNDRHIAKEGNYDKTCFIAHQREDAAYILRRKPEFILDSPNNPLREHVAATKYLMKEPLLYKYYEVYEISKNQIEILIRKDIWEERFGKCKPTPLETAPSTKLSYGSPAR
jgi:arabinofuranosyltransferase